MSPPGIEPATFGFLARHLAPLAIGKIDYLRLKLLLYSEVTGNVWGVSKHAMIQYTLGKIANATPDVLEVSWAMIRFKLTSN